MLCLVPTAVISISCHLGFLECPCQQKQQQKHGLCLPFACKCQAHQIGRNLISSGTLAMEESGEKEVLAF